MLQVLNYMFRNPGNDNVKVNLLYANQSECCEKNENEKRAFKNLFIYFYDSTLINKLLPLTLLSYYVLFFSTPS